MNQKMRKKMCGIIMYKKGKIKSPTEYIHNWTYEYFTPSEIFYIASLCLSVSLSLSLVWFSELTLCVIDLTIVINIKLRPASCSAWPRTPVYQFSWDSEVTKFSWKSAGVSLRILYTNHLFLNNSKSIRFTQKTYGLLMIE